jgi:PqqD family protein of HPr-rel-A system
VSLRRDGALTEKPTTPAGRWCVEPEVAVHRWGTDTVVYVQASAATHWLENDAARVFHAVQAAADPPTTLQLAAALGREPATEDQANLEALLLQLGSLGLVTLAPAPR